ncbi:MAG: hypothetical protein AMXMBFR84_37790 [Candidatus Hydrogenedentota bacterium]
MASAEMTLTVNMPTDIRRLDQYAGPYAIEESAMRSICDSLKAMNWGEHFAAAAPAGSAIGSYEKFGDVAVIDLVGSMTKYGSSFSDLRHGTIGVQRAVAKASRDKDVATIILRIDSPGGSVSGTADLANEVARAAQKKRVIAYIEDMGASAAYWVASQASEIVANDTAIVGSIGVYTSVTDYSVAAAMQGIKVEKFATGKFKGAGLPGTSLTEEQRADIQARIEDIHDLFTGAVSRGRRMSADKISEIADGRVFIGAKAVAVGLVDRIDSLESLINGATKSPKKPQVAANIGDQNMSENKTAQPASFSDLKACLPGATSDQICGYLERNLTLDQAQSAHMEAQAKATADAKAALAAKDAEIAALKEAAAKKPGTQGLGDDALRGEGKAKKDEGGSATDEWNAAVAEAVSKGKSQAAAIRALVRDNPKLHQAYLAEAKANYGRH